MYFISDGVLDFMDLFMVQSMVQHAVFQTLLNCLCSQLQDQFCLWHVLVAVCPDLSTFSGGGGGVLQLMDLFMVQSMVQHAVFQTLLNCLCSQLQDQFCLSGCLS